MYYTLSKDYVLRGWRRLPYAICNVHNTEVEFLRKEPFEAVLKCDGITPIQLKQLSQREQEIIQEGLNANIIVKCEQPQPLTEKQNYFCYPARFIRVAHWSVTGKCNYKCKHCFMSAPEAKFGELSHEQCINIIQQLDECGIRNVSLTGGEPLVRQDFMELVKELVKRKIHITQIYTNGKLVTKELLLQLRELEIFPEFNISYDGPGCHDWLRGVLGAQKSAEAAFSLCREYGFRTGAEMCIYKKNIHTIRQTVQILASLGVESLKIIPVTDAGEWLKNSESNQVSIEEVFEAYLAYIPKFYEDGMPINLMLGGFFSATKHQKNFWIPSIKCKEKKPESEEMVKRRAICGHARNTMYIAADGKLLPCMPLSGLGEQDKYPKITEIALKDALEDSYYMSAIDIRLEEYLSHNPECQQCEYKYQCGGGCRGSAMTFGSDYLGKDMAVCKLFQEHYVERIEQVVREATSTNETLGFHTDFQFITKSQMKAIQKKSKGRE